MSWTIKQEHLVEASIFSMQDVFNQITINGAIDFFETFFALIMQAFEDFKSKDRVQKFV